MCLVIMCLSPAPMALAASTYILSFIERVDDLTSLAVPVHPIIESTSIMIMKLCLPKSAINRIISGMFGRIMMTSVKRIRTSSTAPPRKPETTPIRVPIITVKKAAMKPMVRDTLVPYISSENMS